MLVTKDTSCSRLIILLPSGAGAAARTDALLLSGSLVVVVV